jgi:hypothetical protein
MSFSVSTLGNLVIALSNTANAAQVVSNIVLFAANNIMSNYVANVATLNISSPRTNSILNVAQTNNPNNFGIGLYIIRFGTGTGGNGTYILSSANAGSVGNLTFGGGNVIPLNGQGNTRYQWMYNHK